MPAANPFRIPGTIYKLADRGLAVDTIADPDIDQVKMTARAVICTPAVDRQREIILPNGGDYADYAKNPVVLWEHGFDPNISFPIAASDSEEGELLLSASAEQIEATSRFTTKSMESYQIFGLIVDKIVRATSIHVIPEPDAVKQQVIAGEAVTVYPRWKMLEWSWGCIGVNPEALARVLTAGKIGSDPICAALAKTLRPFAPLPKRNQAQGASLESIMPAEYKPNQGETKEAFVARCVPLVVKSGKAEADAQAEVVKLWDAHAKTLPASGKSKADPPPANGEGEKPTDPPADDTATDEMPSIRVAKAVQSALSQLADNVTAAASTYEDPRAKEYLEGPFMEQCKALLTEVEGLISELGGKSEAKPEGGDKETDKESADEALKSFLAAGSRNRMQTLGIAAPLNSLSTAKNLTAEQRLTIQTVAKNLRGIVTKAKTLQESGQEAALQSKVKEATDTFTSLNQSVAGLKQKLADLVPAA